MQKNTLSDEIYLIDYIKIIWQKKRWLFWFLVLGLILGLVFTYVTPSVYESKGSIKIGKFNKVALEQFEDLKIILSDQKLLKEISQKDILAVNIDVNINQDNQVAALIAQGKNQKEIQDLINKISAWLMKRDENIFNQKQVLLDKNIQEIEAEISIKEKEVDLVNRSIDQLWSPQNETQAITLGNFLGERQFYKREIASLKSQISDLELQKENSQLSEIFSEASLAIKIKPKLINNLAIFTILFVLIGFCWVFALEWWQRNKHYLE